MQKNLQKKKKQESKLLESKLIESLQLQPPQTPFRNSDLIIIKLGDYINLDFDKKTGNIVTITYDNSVNNSTLPCPDCIKWLNIDHIIMKSSNCLGGILAIKTEEMDDDDYPDALSYMILEKVSYSSKINIKIIIHLKIDDTYIKKDDIIDIIYSNITNFWIVLKQDTGFRIVYYYKSEDNYKSSNIDYDSENTSRDYIYTDVTVKFDYICSVWTTYDISPSIIHLVVHDENKNIIILQYTIYDHPLNTPNIVLYDTDMILYDKGKYVSFCANHNISMFSVILEIPDSNSVSQEKLLDTNSTNISKDIDTRKSYTFYTGIITLSNPDMKSNSKLSLEFAVPTLLGKTMNIIQIQTMVLTIMKDAELNILKQTSDFNKIALLEYNKKKEIKNKELKEKAKEKESDLMFKKLLKEEENLVLQSKKKKDKEKRIEEAKLKEKEAKRVAAEEAKRVVAAEAKRVVAAEEEAKRVVAAEEEAKRVIAAEEEAKRVERENIKKDIYVLVNDLVNEIVVKFDKIKEYEISDVETILEKIPDNIYQPYTYFINYMLMINPDLGNQLIHSPTNEIYIELLLNNKIVVMQALDNLVINHPNIIKIRDILHINFNKFTNVDIATIYGSYVTITFLEILNSIGYSCFNISIDDVDCDTMYISLIDEYEFERNQSNLLGYHNPTHIIPQPIQSTCVKANSIHNILNSSWDLNLTSAMIIYEPGKFPYILRHPDFTEFLFGLQPIQLLYGKNLHNLYNPKITEKRLFKAQTKWHH